MSNVEELTDGARRLRGEARELTDVRERLSQAKAHRTWAGPASERFAHSIDRRLREIDEQRDLLDVLARRLDDAATQEAATQPAPRDEPAQNHPTQNHPTLNQPAHDHPAHNHHGGSAGSDPGPVTGGGEG